MKKLIYLCLLMAGITRASAQLPCSNPAFRKLDFWIGEWEAFGPNGKKAGDSKISVILDSCIILEEWSSAAVTNGIRYSGKSFNTFNQSTGQWQQTWVDNVAGTTEFLRGEGSDGKVVFYADNLLGPGGKPYKRRLTFTRLDPDKVRQFGERSDDGGTTWKTEYDLEYRRKK